MCVCVCVCVCVKLKDRKRSLSRKNNSNALWHVKIRHEAKVVSWLLKEMTTSSEVGVVEVTVKTVRIAD